MRIIGLDPGLRHTGWGIVEKTDSSFRFVAAGVINPDTTKSLSERLAWLYQELSAVFTEFTPQVAAVEETFVNQNPASALKLGQARGVVLMTPSFFKVPVFEYSPNQIKKSIVGVGHADKKQVDMMIRTAVKCIPEKIPADASDAIAIALCCGFRNGGKL